MFYIGMLPGYFRKKMGDLATRPPIRRRTERCALLKVKIVIGMIFNIFKRK